MRLLKYWAGGMDVLSETQSLVGGIAVPQDT